MPGKKITLLTCFCIFGFFSARSQYYYQDIYRTAETNRQHQEDIKNQVSQVQIQSLDSQNQPVNDFKCQKEFSAGYQKTTTLTQSFSTGTDYLTSYFDENGRVIYTRDSSAESISHSRMYYNNQTGEIDSLVFISYSGKSGKRQSLMPLMTDTLKETHVFYYTPSGLLQKMVQLKNNRISKTVYFVADSTNHIYKEYQNDKNSPIYYYKYKEDKLTDVFHYSYRQKKIVPDYLFDYDENGRLSKKTVVMSNTHDFLEWHYMYNEKGLISKQLCYNKGNALQGSLIFNYTYRP